ncbi:MAG: serine hydrolase [Lachnospiraceae bacterium]|nr:serine hydrolase [Lachnospiraceae bacterium]
MNFQGWIDDIERMQLDVKGIEVYRGGVLTDSYGDTTQTRFPIYSATKSVLSLAFGIAWEEGLIDPDECVLKYLPRDVVDEMSDVQRETFSVFTIRRLLTMSVGGFPFRPEGDDWLRYSLACPIERPQEVTFDYSNIPSYLVGVALAGAIGGDVWELVRDRILEPLDIVGAEYQRSPEGFFYGASGLELTTNEFSRLGRMLLAGGEYNGKRIVSKEYIETATKVWIQNREGGYGFYFWKYRDGFYLSGKWGKRCYVLPKEDMVLTYIAHMENGSDALVNSLQTHIL